MLKSLIKSLRILTAFIVLLLLSYAIGLVWPMPKLESPHEADYVWVRHVNVVDVETGNVLQNQDIHIHNNRFGASGQSPDDSEFGNVLREVLGTPVPNIVFDGVMPVWRYLTTFGLAGANRHSIHDNDHGGNPHYANADFIGWFGLPFLHAVSTDISKHWTYLSPLQPASVEIRGVGADELGF